MSTDELWYAAGQIDGDGSIGVYGDANNRQGDGTLTVSMGKAENSLHILHGLRATFGGRVNKNRDAIGKYQAMFSWVKSGQDAVKFCLAIKDYVQLKKPQFELASTWYGKPVRGHAVPFVLTHPSFDELYYDSITALWKDPRFQIPIRQIQSWIREDVYPQSLSDKDWKVSLVDKEKITESKQFIRKELARLKKVQHAIIEVRPPAAYFAGIFDAEGSVSVQDFNGMQLSVSQNHRAVCDALLKQFNGGITRSVGKFVWTVSNREDALNFISEILPYSLEKKPQLELVLNMPINGAQDVAKELRKFKGNQGKDPIEKEIKVPKKRLHGLPQYILEIKKNDTVRGYKVVYKGIIRKFSRQEVGLERNLELAKKCLDELKIQQKAKPDIPKVEELPKYIYYKKLQGKIVGLRVNHKNGQAHFDGNAMSLAEHLIAAKEYLSMLVASSK